MAASTGSQGEVLSELCGGGKSTSHTRQQRIFHVVVVASYLLLPDGWQGSSGTLRRSGYGSFIDAHEAVWRFNGAPAGGGYASDVGARTSFAVLADIATSECVDNKAKQPALDGSSPARTLDNNLVVEVAPGWRVVHYCEYYPEASPPATVLFLPRRGGVRRLLDYTIEHPAHKVYIRSDALADEVDAQVSRVHHIAA